MKLVTSCSSEVPEVGEPAAGARSGGQRPPAHPGQGHSSPARKHAPTKRRAFISPCTHLSARTSDSTSPCVVRPVTSLMQLGLHAWLNISDARYSPLWEQWAWHQQRLKHQRLALWERWALQPHGEGVASRGVEARDLGEVGGGKTGKALGGGWSGGGEVSSFEASSLTAP